MNTARKKRSQGLTLVECLVTVTLVATLLRLAVPALGEVITSASVAASSSDILSELRLARSEALKRNWRVTVCKSADGAHCASDGGWEQGWILFHDRDNNGSADTGEEIISRHEALPADLLLRGNRQVADYISFSSSGTTQTVGGAFQAGTLTLCRKSAATTRATQLVLNALGRPRIQKSTVNRCI